MGIPSVDQMKTSIQRAVSDYSTRISELAQTTTEAVSGLNTELDDVRAIAEAASGGSESIRYAYTSVTLPVANWVDNQQTVSANGVTADNIIVSAPQPDSWESVGEHGIHCIAQATNSLTFACGDAPSFDVTYNILIMEVT